VKVSSALHQSRVALPIAGGFVVSLGVAAWFWPNWFTYTILAIALLGFVIDAVNIVFIRVKAIRDPGFLSKKVE
jgi:hypothetical protein